MNNAKKWISLLLVLLVAVGVTGCGRGAGASQAATPQAPAAEEGESGDDDAAPAGETGSGAAEFVIKAGHIVDEENSLHKAFVAFKEEVERESGGRIAVEILPNGLMGGDRELVEGVELGTLEMAAPASTVVVTDVAEFGILDMPFLFSSAQTGFQALDNELGEHLNKLLNDKTNIINLEYGYNGARSVSNSVRPILEPDDLSGIKIRVMESPIYIDTFKALGANPTPMSFGEVFTALQQKTVDAQDNAATLTYSSRFHEAQDYFTETGHTHSFLLWIINENFYNSLPDDLRAIVDAAARTNLAEGQRAMEIAERDEAIEAMRADGVQIDEITPENYQKFVDAVQSVYEKNADVITPELVEMARMYN